MTRALAPLLLLLLCLPVRAEDDVAELARKRDAKRAEAWFTALPWSDALARAREQARSSGKPIFGYFTRSYAPCPPCASLERGPLSSPAFAAFAAKVVLFAHVTTRIPGTPDDDLFQRLGFRGYPTVAFLDAEGTLVGLPEDRTVAGFERGLERVLRLRTLRAAGGDPGEALVLEVELGLVNLEAARARRDALAAPLSPELRERLGRGLIDLEVEAGMVLTDEAAKRAHQARCAELLRGDLEPLRLLTVWFLVILGLEHAEREGDAATFERGFALARRRFADEPGMEPRWAELEARLARLRAR